MKKNLFYAVLSALVPIDFTTEVKPFVDAEGQDINFTNPSNQ